MSLCLTVSELGLHSDPVMECFCDPRSPGMDLDLKSWLSVSGVLLFWTADSAFPLLCGWAGDYVLC